MKVDAHELGPSEDAQEFTIGAGVVDVSSIGGYPVRVIEIVNAGGGTLVFHTVQGDRTTSPNRTFTGLTAGYVTQKMQISSIRGTSDGSNVTSIRVYK